MAGDARRPCISRFHGLDTRTTPDQVPRHDEAHEDAEHDQVAAELLLVVPEIVARTQETMYSRRKKVRTGTKKVETLLRKFNKSRDSDGAGPRKSGQKWEWANKSLNIANSATEYLHFVGDSTKQLVLGN